MAPSLSSAEHALTYPLYACEFDPRDASRLIVAGGGGEGRSGVGNKISLLDLSHPDTIAINSELELSRDEDNPTTLAIAGPKGKTTVVCAGINSGERALKKGKNDHFRVFGVEQPSKTTAIIGPAISELARASLFSSPEVGAYQRLLRIAPAAEGATEQVGAVATGFAKEHEIVVFSLSSAEASPQPKSMGSIKLMKEAMDLDVIQTGDGEWQLAYCDDYELYLMNINKASEGPELVFTMPNDVNYKTRPKIRAIRYLTTGFLLVAANVPNGVVLNVFRLPKPGQPGRARIATSKKVPKLCTRAVGLAVRNLTPPPSPGAPQEENTQFVIALASNEGALVLYTLEYQFMGDLDLFANLFPFATIKEAHAGPITGLNFSHFTPPKTSTMREMTVRLATVGTVGNKVLVHTIPLKKVLDKSAALPTKKEKGAAPRRSARYVVALKPHKANPTLVLTSLAIFIAIASLLVQFYMEAKGISQPVLGLQKYAPASWAPTLKQAPPAGFLADALINAQQDGTPRVVLDDGTGGQIKVDAHDAEQHGAALKWDDLPVLQQDAWKARLKEAGHWGEEQGETILKNLFFGEIAGLVEGFVRG